MKIKPFNKVLKNSRDIYKKRFDETKKISLLSQFNYLTTISKPFIKLIEKAQDKLEKSIDNEKEEVLLKQSPYWAKSLTWTLIGTSFLGVFWLSLAKTEEIIVVQGRLETIK